MGKNRIKPNYRRRVLRLPDLDHCKASVLNSLGSSASRRVYEYAIDQFIAWYCSEPRLAFNRIVVVRYPCTWNQEGWPRTPRWWILGELSFERKPPWLSQCPLWLPWPHTKPAAGCHVSAVAPPANNPVPCCNLTLVVIRLSLYDCP
jgi:hypothetical protein